MENLLPFSGRATGRSIGPAGEALLSLCRRGTDAGETQRVVEALLEVATVGDFHSLADSHHVCGLALSSLQKRLPTDLRAQPEIAALLQPLRARRRRALLWQFELDRILRMLAGRHLRPILLKGPALWLTAYADPVERRVGDLDVLVTPEEVDPTVQILVEAGYRAPPDLDMAAYKVHHFHFRLLHPKGFMVEVHWGLSQPASQFRVDAPGLLRRAREASRDGVTAALVPSAEDMILHLSSQNLENNFSELRRLVDLDRIVSGGAQLDWDYTATAARAGGLETVLALSLRLSRDLLGTDVSDPVLRTIDPPPLIAWHLDILDPARSLLTQYGRHRAAQGRLLSLWLMVRWVDRMAALGGILTAREYWLWTLHDPEGKVPSVSRRITTVIKLFAFQGWRYLVASWRLPQRRRLRA